MRQTTTMTILIAGILLASRTWAHDHPGVHLAARKFFRSNPEGER